MWRSHFCMVIVIYWANIAAAEIPCPHDVIGLRSWSDASKWPKGKKPVADEDVVISDDVLFDDITPRIRTVTIKPHGRLVWSPLGDYHMTVSTILVEGRLDIGSEECKFDAKAHITLTGDRDTAPKFTDGNDQKGIILMGGGTLEIHGKQKLSWTKLTSTLSKLSESGAIIFDHSAYIESDVDPKIELSQGLYVYVFERTFGDLVDFATFKTITKGNKLAKSIPKDFKKFLESIEDGNVVMIASHKKAFSKKLQKDLVYEAVETLLYGPGDTKTKLREVVPDSGDSYAMIAIKGDTSKSQEVFAPTDKSAVAQSAKVVYLDWDNGYKYAVEGYFHNELGWKSGAVFNIMRLEGAFPILDVVDDSSSWRPGDQIFLTSTDYDWEQAEEATVMECLDCSTTQVKIDLEAQYTHWGEITDGVDMRGEVALLTRNILIEGEVQDECPKANGNCKEFPFDTFGGHLKVHRTGFKNVHIEGAEFYHMGQQTDKGHYPIHFHMCEDVDGYDNPPYVRDNSIHDSFARCITVHGTHGLTLQDNVGYKAMGHCFFLEDGGEQRTVLDGNLGASIQNGNLVPTDGMKNILDYKSFDACAQQCGGRISEPLHESRSKGWLKPDQSRRTAILEFTNNVAHSCKSTGLLVEDKLNSNDEIIQFNDYEAREDPLDDTSPFVEVNFHRATLYKCGKQNAWIRGVWMTMQQSGISDSARGITFAGGNGNQNSLNTSIILGSSPNKGEPGKKKDEVYDASFPVGGIPDYPLIGYLQYGTPVRLYDTWFNHFATTAQRNAGALGFMRGLSHPTSPMSSLRNIGWGFDDGVSFGNRLFDGDEDDKAFGPPEDGDKAQIFRDLDGSTTGRADAMILANRPFHLTDKCHFRENWKMAACPYRYGKLKIKPKGAQSGTLPFMMRDDLKNIKEDRTHVDPDFLVILGSSYSYTLHWTTSTPKSFKIIGRGVEKGFPVRIGICLPLDAKFELERSKPYKTKWGEWTAAGSVEEIDDDQTGKKYYWDSKTGLLFVKFQHDSTFPSEGFIKSCPDEGCDTITVTLNSGTTSDSDCSGRSYGPYKKNVSDTTDKLTLPDVMPKTSSSPPDGYGAGSTRPFQTRKPVDGAFGQWNPWGPCSASCDGGEMVKTRACDSPIPQHGGKLCVGDRIKRQSCNTEPC